MRAHDGAIRHPHYRPGPLTRRRDKGGRALPADMFDPTTARFKGAR
jgi:hypothetical protein